MLAPLYTAAEMREAEERHPGYPETATELMERAGAAVARELLSGIPTPRRIAVVCGGGSNGGDGRVAVRHLREAGREAEETDDVEGADVVVDALFGTGFHGEPRPGAAARIERINAVGAPVVAVDVPSGVDASTGEIAGAAVRAALTVTFAGPKVGLHVAPGAFHTGEIVVADIGLEPVATGHRLVTDEILRLVPLRGPADTKYTAGSVLVVGGAPGLTGAACLAAEAAFRADAGYVAVAVPEAALPVVEGRLLEAVKLSWAGIDDALQKARAVALGPGLGRSDEARGLVHACSERSRCRSSSTPTRSSGWSRSGGRLWCSRRTRESLDGCWARARSGWTRTGSRRWSARQSGSAASASSRAPTRSSPHPARAYSSGLRRRTPSRRPAPATSSPESSPRSSPRGSRRAWPRRRARRHTGSPQRGRHTRPA